MFPFPHLPSQWEKRVIFFLLHKLNLLEERTLGDLDNLQGTAGQFTFKNIGIKVERLRDLLKIPPRLVLREAVIGTLSIRLPVSLFYSGSVEIVVSDVRIAAALNPVQSEDPIPSPRSPRSSATRDEDEDDEEFPKTAEDLAESFLHAQTDDDKKQLLSIYSEGPLASSVHSTASTVLEDDDAEVGVGASLGLPSLLTNVFKGMLDRLTVKIQGTTVSLDTILPEERGGERVLLTVEIDDVDVEGVSRNVAPVSEEDASDRAPREGKRRITLENIQGYVTSVVTLFETDDTQASTVFGTQSEVSTERAMGGSTASFRSTGTEVLTQSAHNSPSQHEKPLNSPQPEATSRRPSSQGTIDVAKEAPRKQPEDGEEVFEDSESTVGRSVHSEGGRFQDFEDESDDEVLAFAPTISQLRNSGRLDAYSDGAGQPAAYDDDSEDEAEGGASFSPSMRPRSRSKSPPEAVLPTETATPATSAQLALVTPDTPDPPVPSISPDYETDSSDEMDQEASRLLSESAIFSREDADSLYMSATSGMLREDEPVRHIEHDLRELVEGEELDSQEMDDRLDRLINGDMADDPADEPLTPRAQSPVTATPKQSDIRRKVKKRCLGLDRVTIFYPAFTDTPTTTNAPITPIIREEYVEEHRHREHGHIPGAFSMYAPGPSGSIASSPPRKTPSELQPPLKRTPPKVKIAETNTMGSDSIFGHGDINPTRTADIEIILGDFRGTVDLPTEKALAHVLETFQTAIQEGKKDTPKKTPDRSRSGEGKTLQLFAEEMDIRMVERLSGVFLDTKEEITGDPTVRLQCLLNDVRLFRKPHSEDASTSQLDVKKFQLSDEEEGIITFIPPLPPSTKISRRRASPGAPYGGRDISVVFSQNATKKRVNIITNPIRLHFDLKRLEEAFSAFGGVGSVLASTTASTATITKARQQPPWKETSTPAESTVNTKIDARLGGLVVEVVGTSGGVNLKTSPVRIRSETGHGVDVKIDTISIVGPQVQHVPAEVKIGGARIEFASTPTQEDLSRLLELLTPSKDSFDNDDILIDTLLRQREQGSVLRVSLQSVHTEVNDPSKDVESLKVLGDEVIKVLTATDFVAGDERPGLLTLVNIEMVSTSVQLDGIGSLHADMEGVGLTHVSAPSLIALAAHTLGIRRNESDELIGEGLERRMFLAADYGRPMAMVRMVGDEPEPVLRIKLWNLKAEYRVETLLEMMQAPENATGETIAQEMVDSIVGLPPPTKEKDKDSTTSMGFDIVASDCVLGLNPLDSKSRGLVILTDFQLQAALPVGGTLRAGMVIKKASVMVIDNIENLLPADPEHKSRRKEALSSHLASFASMGYVNVVSVSSAKAQLRVIECGPKGEKAVDLDVSDDLLLLESCADSTQTLLSILNGLKPPLPETEEVKYCTEVMPVDMLASLDEGAFIPANRKKAGDVDLEEFQHVAAESPSLEARNDFAFVESYYGHVEEPGPEEDKHGFESIEGPSWVPPPMSTSSSMMSKGKVQMLDDEPLLFQENHFGATTQKPKSQRSLNEEAVNKAPYIPLHIRAHDIHVIWNLHDGYDWQRTRDTISQAVKRVESKAAERRERKRRVSFDIDDDEDSVVDDFLFNSIYIGIPSNHDPKDLTGEINRNFDDHTSETSYATTTAESSRPLSSRSRGNSSTDSGRRSKGGLKLARSHHHKLQLELKGVGADLLLFPPGSGEVQSSVDLKVRDLEIFDNVPTSTWRKFLTYMQDAGGRETGSNMAHIEILNVRPVPELAATELVLKVSILPLRLHVDQDTLDFLTRFFEFKDDTAEPSKPSSSTDQPFLQRVEVNAVRVKLDYKPKKVDYAGLRSGHTTEFMNFFILEESDMVLRRVILHGISGFQRMGVVLNDTWMPDIKKTQLGDVIAGVAPVRSLVNLGLGVRNLVVVPVREYRKDGRVVRSLQKGVNRFVKTSATEMVRLGAKVAVGTQALLQGAEGALEGPRDILDFPSDEEAEVDRRISLYADQPEGVVQGLRGASRSLKRNFGDARDAILAVPGEAASTGSAGGAARAVARAAPRAALRPMIGMTEAVSKTLQGVTNALDPEMRRRADEKYKKPH